MPHKCSSPTWYWNCCSFIYLCLLLHFPTDGKCRWNTEEVVQAQKETQNHLSCHTARGGVTAAGAFNISIHFSHGSILLKSSSNWSHCWRWVRGPANHVVTMAAVLTPASSSSSQQSEPSCVLSVKKNSVKTENVLVIFHFLWKLTDFSVNDETINFLSIYRILSVRFTDISFGYKTENSVQYIFCIVNWYFPLI